MKMIIIVMLILLLVGLVEGSDSLKAVALKQPGINNAAEYVDNNSYMIGILPDLYISSNDRNQAIITLIKAFGKLASEIGYDGKLQIGVTDQPGRVVYMLDISARDAITYINDTEWLQRIEKDGRVFEDDTRNYDPYGNRYTPFPDGKGVLGAMVFRWLGY